MTSERPLIIILHYWGTGPAELLAIGFKAAVSELRQTLRSLNHRPDGATTSASSSHRPVLSRVHTRTYAPVCGAAPAISYLP